MYQPDNWILIKIMPGGEDLFYKVLAGWSGGYLDGDSWRMNSGVDRVEEDGDYYDFIGASGSVYRCHKESEMLRMNCGFIYEQMKEKWGDKIERIDYADFVKEFVPGSL